MPGLAGTPHHNFDRHIRIAREDDFGECPAVPDWQDIPVLGDGWKLKASSPHYFPDTNLAGYRRTAVCHRMEVAGAFTTLAWVGFLDFLLDMALERDANDDVYSYVADYYTPVDPRRYLGIVAETLALRATGTGDGDLQLELGLRAKLEEENDALVVGDYDYDSLVCVPFMFRDAVLQLDAVDVMDIETFTINVNNNVAQGPYIRTPGTPLGTVAHLVAGRREVSLDLGQACKDDRFNEAIRSCGTISFEASLYHPLGHLFQIQLPMLVAQESEETVDPREPAKESTTLQAVVPCEGGSDIVYGVDLGPTTTTLEALTTTPAGTTTTAAL